MVKKLLAGSLLAAVAIAAWLIIMNNSDEKRIIKTLSGLTDCVSKHSGEKTSVMLFKSQILLGYFDDMCILKIDDSHLSGAYTPENISSNMTRIRSFFKEISLNFYDTKISFPSPDKAVVTMTGHLTGTLKRGNRINESRELKAELRKSNGKWLVYNLEVQEILKK